MSHASVRPMGVPPAGARRFLCSFPVGTAHRQAGGRPFRDCCVARGGPERCPVFGGWVLRQVDYFRAIAGEHGLE